MHAPALQVVGLSAGNEQWRFLSHARVVPGRVDGTSRHAGNSSAKRGNQTRR